MAQQKKRGPGRPPGSKNKKSSQPAPKAAPKSKEEHIKDIQYQLDKDRRTIDVIWSISLFALGIFLGVTIFLDTTGSFGQKIHDITLGLFGIMAYVLPFLFILSAILLLMRKLQHIGGRTVFFSIMIFFMMCIINSSRFIDPAKLAFGFQDIGNFYRQGMEGNMGGAIGMELGSLLVKGFGKPGLFIFSIAVLVISIFLVANTPISDFFSNLHKKREEKKIMKELEEAEKEKIQQAVAATSAQTSMYSDPMQDTVMQPMEVSIPDRPAPVEEPIKQRRTIFGGRKVEQQDAGSGKQYASPSHSINPGKYDSVTIGSSKKKQSKKSTGYGLGDYENNFGNSGTYGLSGDDGYSTPKPAKRKTSNPGYLKKTDVEEKPEKTVKKEDTGVKTEEKPKRVIKTADDRSSINPAVAFPIDANTTKKASDKDVEKVGDDLQAALSINKVDALYELPSPSLLKKGTSSKQMMTDFQLEERADLLEQTLRDFGVEATVLSVTQGASVTRYEVQPATGVKVSSITRLADDIALNLRAKSIRIEAPIPGKAAVGIEVENEKPAPVHVRDLIESEEFANAESKLSFVVGKDISGGNVIADLQKMPHLLIAGATGSGKSVCINTIIASFLYKAKPNELKMIMIDPKVVELQSYNGIPHMLVPVVTDPRKAAKALAIAVEEMNKRYDAFAAIGVKDLESYNDYMRAEHEPQNCKPQIVVIIDELADLMMACSNEVENSICRLAQKARAAGMHLIVATQRPSVDVVTGLIKANIPSRIAFSVSSQIDSRTILDMAGAEKLLGRGDMLFAPVGASKPYRVQGPFISEAESNKLIKFVKQQGGDAIYDEEVQNAINSDGKDSSKQGDPQDDLTEEAIAFILKNKQASVSMLQRRFRIGYNRAARIIDEIEEMGIIGPSDGSRPRQVLISEDEYYGGAEDVEEAPEEVVQEQVETEPEYVEEIEYVTDPESAVEAFSNLPESVQKELLSSDD